MGIDLKDRIIGTMFGLAIGDALGAPVEGAKQGAIRNAYKKLTDYVDAEGWVGREKIYKWRKPGLYTDDTQQALVLLDSVLQDRGLNPDSAAKRFADLARGAEYRFGVYRGAGSSFKSAIADYRQGITWSACGGNSFGPGAASRIAPVAVYYHKDLDQMAIKVIEASLFTHKNPVGISAALAVAYLISRCLATEELAKEDTAELIVSCADFCRQKEDMLARDYGHYLHEYEDRMLHVISGGLTGLAERIGNDRKRVLEWIVSHAALFSDVELTRPSVKFAPACVVFAIYEALSHPDSIEDAIVSAVNEGGDADTVGAITGAISGALHGVEAIPERWMKNLANRKQLKARAEALAAGKWMPGKLEDLYEMEYGLTGREHEERLARMKKFGVDFPEKKHLDKLSEPEVIHGKYDRKKQRREIRRFKQWEP